MRRTSHPSAPTDRRTNRRHLHLAVAAVTSLTLVAGAVTAAGVASAETRSQGTDASRPTGTKTLDLTWNRVHDNYVDVGEPGPSSGDTVQFAFTISGQKRGTADYSCSVVQTRFLCDGVIRLSDGDLYVSTGPVDDSKPAAVVGGTRAYSGARGEFTKTARADDLAGTYRISYTR